MSNSVSAATSAAAALTATSGAATTSIAFNVAGFPVPYPYPTQAPPDGLLWPPFYPYPPPPPSPGLPWRQAPPNGVFPVDSPIPPSWPMGFPWPPPLKNDPRIRPSQGPPPGAGPPPGFGPSGAVSTLNPTFPYPLSVAPTSWTAPVPTFPSTKNSSTVSNGTSSSSPFDDSTIPSNITLICSLATALIVFGFIMCIGWWIRRRYFAVRDQFGRPTATKLMPVVDNPTALEQSSPNTGHVWNDRQPQFQTLSERSVGWSEVPTLAGQPVGGGGGPDAEQRYQRALISHNLDQVAFVPGGVHTNTSSRMLGYAPTRAGPESGTFLVAQEKHSPISWISPHPQQQYHQYHQQQLSQQHELVARGGNSIELDHILATANAGAYPRNTAPFASPLQPQKYKLPDVA
ncbi:hypothetical protein HDU81_000805 [Chytriomyces hyalinus]|nr:hypothetical protein HDU81_000805 [Chytriomyces hyalinus]